MVKSRSFVLWKTFVSKDLCNLQLILHYEIPEFKTCEEFLSYIARKGGRLKKGGRPDLNAAARKACFKA